MRPILLVLLATASLTAKDPLTITGRGFSASVFDSAGNLSRRLTADSTTAAADATRLEKGRVEFFAPESADRPVAVLDFDEALYRKSDESIRGDGSIRLTSAQGTAFGHGYEYGLETGLLKLESDVKFSSADFRLAGREGEIRFDPKGSGKTDLIQEVVVKGGVTVERTVTAKAPFDRAETELARYNAGQQKIFLKTPLTTFAKNGDKTISNLTSGFYEIDLKEKPGMPP